MNTKTIDAINVGVIIIVIVSQGFQGNIPATLMGITALLQTIRLVVTQENK